MTIQIRLATVNDLTQLLPLMGQLGYPQSMPELCARVELYVSNPQYGIAVATLDNKIAGWIGWSITQLLVSSKTRIHIEGLIVDADYRGHGIGKALMQYVEDLAQTYKPCVIDLTSGLRRKSEGTHEFYQSMGYGNEGKMAKVYFRKEI